MIGKTVSHYKILEKLGEGGMGVVYKAEDTKLKRDVALKFLPANALQGGAEKDRFLREAHAAAALNHANIAHIYAVDEVDDQAFIAMEYIEGQSLSEMVASPLPLDKAIDYATQIAAGLQVAHEKGVVHRDIKSANIMVTGKCVVKIMDFGLAKLADRSMMTQEGTTLGTAAYMSPEQSRGEKVDHRSDIWSLGVILYEMISGQLPFKGEYESAVIYSIQNEDPEPLTALRSGVPIALDGIIAKALAKDSGTRYQNVEDLPADLKGIDIATLSKSRIVTKSHTAKTPAWKKVLILPWLVAGLMTCLAAAGLWYAWRANTGDRPEAGVKRVSVPLSPSDGLEFGDFALSPDGKVLAFVGRNGEKRQLFVRHLNREGATALAGTEFGRSPFFSPDGRWVGFRMGTTLKKVSVDGGSPIDICNASAQAASWGAKEEIVFSQTRTEKPWELMRVSAQGGLPEPLATAESEASGYAMDPQVLPGGRHVLFMHNPTTGNSDDANIVVHSIESGERRMLIRGGTNPYYSPTGHIIYARSGTLMAVPFDLESLTITGLSSPLAEQASTNPTGGAYFTLSMDGTLIYLDETQVETRLVWVERQGRVTTLSAPAHYYWDPRLSKDGSRLAVNVRDSENEVWVYELARSTLTRLTVNPGEDETAFWSPDGRWIAFASSRVGQPRTVFRKLADGSGGAEPLWTSDHHVHVECWSADGRSIIVSDVAPTTNDDLWLLRLDDEISARPLLQTQFSEFGGRISPDGRWLAYTSDESGNYEVYVQAFPALGHKVQVSTNGGSQPVWARDGKELFYRGEGQIMAVTVAPGETFVITSPNPLFPDHYDLPAVKHTGYDVATAGKRFLMIQGEGRRTNLNVVFNWFDEVKRLAPESN